MKQAEAYLKERGITPTPVRVLVYRCLNSSDTPMSLSDIEMELNSVDKSTISRTLSMFRDNHLLHAINDGSGSVKYEVCRSHGEEHDDMHVHFRCRKCGETICLHSVMIPDVILPAGYVAEEKSYIISGVCEKCEN